MHYLVILCLASVDHPCLRQNGDCEHLCIPTGNGVRTCMCATGYRLENSGKKCVGQNSFLLFTTDKQIRGITMDKNAAEAINPISGTKLTSVDVDVRTRAVYFSDAAGENRGINRVELDSGRFTKIIESQQGTAVVQNIAVDWVNYNLYFINVDTDRTTIEVSRLDGTFKKILFTSKVQSPRSIVVDPISRLTKVNKSLIVFFKVVIFRYLFWIDRGQMPALIKANLDCTERSTLVNSGLVEPREILVDMNGHYVYWTDSKVCNELKFACR